MVMEPRSKPRQSPRGQEEPPRLRWELGLRLQTKIGKPNGTLVVAVTQSHHAAVIAIRA